MDVIVRTVSRIVFPLCLLLGAYITLHGHLTPGGGFPGGVVIATAFLLMMLAFGSSEVEKKFAENQLTGIKGIAGIGLILLIVYFGAAYRTDLIGGQTFFRLWSGGYTLLTNVLGALMVATAFIIIAYRMVKE